MRKYLLFCTLAMLFFAAMAIKPTWLYVTKVVDDNILRLHAVELADIDSISFRRSFTEDSLSYDRMIVALNSGDSIDIDMNEYSSTSFSINVPSIIIDTDLPAEDVSSKSEYLSGNFIMKGFGVYDDVDTVRVKVRGRGNTSWNEPKKPYRLKFDKKISLCGLKKAKNYVLIANHIDNTLMKNAVAFETARLMGLPYTNHSIPVNVFFNCKYKGAYMLSEKIGINSGSVDIDEQSGIMWELDVNYDEDYKFRSSWFNTPVMLKDPDPEDVSLADSLGVDQWFKEWKSDYTRMEREIRQGNYQTVVDEACAVDYVLVNLLACNCELNWPKSVNLYKESPDSLYKFGPVWDYDWAFNYVYPVDRPLFNPGYSDLVGANLFYRMIHTDRFMDLFKKRWQYFKSEIYPQLMDFIYMYRIYSQISAYQNGQLWSSEAPTYTKNSSENFDENVDALIEWIDGRIKAIDEHENMLLY